MSSSKRIPTDGGQSFGFGYTGHSQNSMYRIAQAGSTLYAGLDKVAISSEVWVDPIDRERLKFDDWKTANPWPFETARKREP